MFFLITVATSTQNQFFEESILRDQACIFWGESIFYINLLRGTNPDSQLTQLFLGFLLEALQWVQIERDTHIFSCDKNSMNIFPISWYLTILGLHA